jgi:hypothetical protein
VTALPDGTPAYKGDGVRPQTIYDDLQRLFERVAQSLDGKDRLGAQRLRLASAHWLGHTSASTAVAAGVPLDVVGTLLGHASLTTTSHYVHAESHRVTKEMKKLLEAAELKHDARRGLSHRHATESAPVRPPGTSARGDGRPPRRSEEPNVEACAAFRARP